MLAALENCTMLKVRFSFSNQHQTRVLWLLVAAVANCCHAWDDVCDLLQILNLQAWVFAGGKYFRITYNHITNSKSGNGVWINVAAK